MLRMSMPIRWTQRLLRSEEHTSELQSRQYLVCRLLLEKKKSMEISGRLEWLKSDPDWNRELNRNEGDVAFCIRRGETVVNHDLIAARMVHHGGITRLGR